MFFRQSLLQTIQYVRTSVIVPLDHAEQLIAGIAGISVRIAAFFTENIGQAIG